MKIIILGIILFLLIFIICFIPTIINIQFLKDKNNDQLIIAFNTFFGLFKYKIEIPIIDWMINKKGKVLLNLDTEIKESEDEKTVEEKKSFLSLKDIKRISEKVDYYYEKYFSAFNYLIKKTKIEDLYWVTHFGFIDAFYTGILSGLIWGLKGNIIQIITKKIKTDKIFIDVLPRFNKNVFHTDLNCILSVKIGNIIIATIKFFYTFIIKGGARNGKSSN